MTSVRLRLDASALGGLYGLALGLVFCVLIVIDGPILWALYWSVETIHLSWYTVVVWQRTHLRLETAGGAIAAAGSAAFVVASLAGYTLPDLSARGMALLVAGAAGMIAMQALAWWLHRDIHRKWRRHMQGLSLVDMLCMRHIPDLTTHASEHS